MWKILLLSSLLLYASEIESGRKEGRMSRFSNQRSKHVEESEEDDYVALSKFGNGKRTLPKSNAQHPHLASLMEKYNAEKRHHQQSKIPQPVSRVQRPIGRKIGESRGQSRASFQRCEQKPESEEPASNPTSVRNADYCRCGERLETKPNKFGRIIGGIKAKKYEFPWRCALMIPGDESIGEEDFHFCGAAVITHTHLLTAAHCFIDPLNRNRATVVCHLHDYFSDEEKSTRVERKVVDIFDHEEFDNVTFENDISIVKMDPPLAFDDELQPICLPFSLKGDSLKDLTVTVSGWGLEEYAEKGPTSPVQKKITLTTISAEECAEYWENADPKVITRNNVCSPINNVAPCTGDSGGSVDYRHPETGKYMNIGVVSFGALCNMAGYPTVYTKVTSYLDWIVRKTEGEPFCRI